MPPFDYSAPAELFLAKRTKSRRENYRRFATAAEAVPLRCRALTNAQSLRRVAWGRRRALQQRWNRAPLRRAAQAWV